ncbi:MAG: universal stress protein [Tepidiformaceae bacterium]
MNLDHGAIIVPLDGSNEAEAVLLPASQLARAYNAPVEFVHVVDVDSRSATPSPELPADRFDAYVASLLGQSGIRDLEWSASLLVGAPAETILEAAAGARVVVIATHGRGGFHAAFIGSVTDKVVRSSRLPVLTVPVQGQPNLMAGPILVGLDGSETAEAALPVVRDLAPRLGVGIGLVRAYSVTPSAGTEFGVYEYDTVTILKEGAEEYLKLTAREGETAFTAMTSPAAAIAQAADQLGAGLITLTSHGRGLAYGLALGSTTDRVIHSVRRPVLVLPSE